MNKKLFLAATLLFAITGGVSKAAPAMLEARGNYMAVNDTIIDENAIVEISAQYPGGEAAIRRFIEKNTKYPEIALEQEIQGEAIVEFYVKEDGTIGEVTILKSISAEYDKDIEKNAATTCDQAVMDAVRKLKRFIPAKVKGKPARSWFKLPVSFHIEHNARRVNANDYVKPSESENKTEFISRIEASNQTGDGVYTIIETSSYIKMGKIEYSHNRFEAQKNLTIIEDNVLVETPLTYPGGEAALCDFINKNTEYPLIALNKNIQGEVVVTVRIEKDGKVGDVTIMKSLSRECDQAVVDAVRKLKRFIPAKQNGIPIPSGVWLPVSFKIEKKHGRLSGKVSANYQDVIIGWEGYFSLTGDNICINVPVSYDCSSSLSYWIARKTQYPHKALCNDTQGDAVVEFCVKEDGTIDEVSMLKSLSPECDQALMDAVHKIKRIAPTKEAGKPTPVWLKVPVSFKIDEDRPEFSPESTKELSNTITKIQKVSGKVIVNDIEWSYSPFNNRKNRK